MILLNYMLGSAPSSEDPWSSRYAGDTKLLERLVDHFFSSFSLYIFLLEYHGL